MEVMTGYGRKEYPCRCSKLGHILEEKRSITVIIHKAIMRLIIVPSRP